MKSEITFTSQGVDVSSSRSVIVDSFDDTVTVDFDDSVVVADFPVFGVTVNVIDPAAIIPSSIKWVTESSLPWETEDGLGFWEMETT